MLRQLSPLPKQMFLENDELYTLVKTPRHHAERFFQTLNAQLIRTLMQESVGFQLLTKLILLQKPEEHGVKGSHAGWRKACHHRG